MSRIRFSQGSAAVELALVAVPMVLIALLAFEFSFMLNQYHSLSKRVHDAARYLTRFDPYSTSEFETRSTEAFNLIQGADIKTSTSNALPALNPQNQNPISSTCTTNCVFVCSTAYFASVGSTPTRCSSGNYYVPNTGSISGIATLTVGVFGFEYAPRFLPSAVGKLVKMPVVAVTLPHGS